MQPEQQQHSYGLRRCWRKQNSQDKWKEKIAKNFTKCILYEFGMTTRRKLTQSQKLEPQCC